MDCRIRIRRKEKDDATDNIMLHPSTPRLREHIIMQRT